MREKKEEALQATGIIDRTSARQLNMHEKHPQNMHNIHKLRS